MTYAVSTSHPDASRTALELLASGGNAVDAAVAAAWVLATVEPSGSGVGGQACLLLATAQGEVHAVDGDARAPLAAARGSVSARDQRIGARATTVPTMPAVLAESHRRWGRLPWPRVVAPAVELAADGHTVTPGESHRTQRVVALLRRDPDAAAAYLRSGRAPRPGTRRRLPHLARTLTRIAADGATDLYDGALARSLLADQAARGGLIAAEDLYRAARAVRVRPALTTHRHGLRIATLPEAGGAALLTGLSILDQVTALDPGAGVGAAWSAALARAVRAAHDLRDAGLLPSGPDEDAADRVQRAARDIVRSVPPWTAPLPRTPREEPGDTTHVSVVDGSGTAVSLTSSIQSLFGAKTSCTGLGFLYNNYLTTCTRRRGPYRLGPCCRPRSNAAPTIVLDEEGPLLVAGSAGSRRITSSLLHVLTAVLDHGLPLQAAVEHPRSHLLASGHLWVEAGDIAPRPPGERVIPLSASSPAMGCVNAVARAGSTWTAAADPRRDGVALVSGGTS